MRQPLHHAAIPMLATTAGLVLVLLALTAGLRPNPMEDYSIVMFNTSELERHVSRSATTPVGSVGLHQFYSLHVLSLCEGDFTDSKFTNHVALNVTSCLRVTRTAQFNLTALFARDIGAGSSGTSLAGLGFTQDLMDAFNRIPTTFMAVAALFITGTILMGLSLGASVCAVLAVQRARLALLASLVLAWLAWFVLLVATASSQDAASTVARKVNELGNHAGLSAASGTRFSAITWASVCLALVAALSWSWTFARRPRQLDDQSFGCVSRTRLQSGMGSMVLDLEGHDEVVETKVLGRRSTLVFTMVQPPPSPQAAYLTENERKDSV